MNWNAKKIPANKVIAKETSLLLLTESLLHDRVSSRQLLSLLFSDRSDHRLLPAALDLSPSTAGVVRASVTSSSLTRGRSTVKLFLATAAIAPIFKIPHQWRPGDERTRAVKAAHSEQPGGITVALRHCQPGRVSRVSYLNRPSSPVKVISLIRVTSPTFSPQTFPRVKKTSTAITIPLLFRHSHCGPDHYELCHHQRWR